MTSMTVCPASDHIDLPCLNKVDWWQPFLWLQAGWHDFRHNLAYSLAIGCVFAVLGYVITRVAWIHEYLALTLTSGFLLVSPFLALGFYELSRRSEGGAGNGGAFRENLASIGLFALLLMFALSTWERLNAIVLGLYLGPRHVEAASLSWLFSGENLEFVVAFFSVGALVAALIFALSVVSLPMLMDRRVDLVTAVVSSLYAVRLNPLPMLLWALTIVVLAIIGSLPMFIGMAVIFPILGHATWHAYRDLVVRPAA